MQASENIGARGFLADEHMGCANRPIGFSMGSHRIKGTIGGRAAVDCAARERVLACPPGLPQSHGDGAAAMLRHVV